LRSALRAYALDVDDPGEVLHKLDRKAHHFEYGTMATVSYAVVDRSRDQVSIALAGHLPPVLAVPAGDVVLAAPQVGPPIGFLSGEGRYHSAVLTLSPGALLCFYTDGLVERRDSTIDVGLRKLRDTVSTAPPETVCAKVMAAMVGAEAVRDDIAVLAMRRDAA
jgi:serine phosphatase RsbU (regulator of sigma subunit)